MMTFEEFANTVIAHCNCNGIEVEEKEMAINNGGKCHLLSMTYGDGCIIKNFSLENLYEVYLKDGFITAMGKAVEYLRKAEDYDLSVMQHFETAAPFLTMRLVNYGLNRSMLKEMPHRRYLDLAIIYYCKKDDLKTRVTNEVLERWGVTEEDLYKVAFPQTKVGCEPMFCSLFEARSRASYRTDFNNICSDGQPAVVSSVYSSGDGVVSLCYSDLLERIGMAICGGFYIIPSSIDDYIIVPEDFTGDVQQLKQIISKVNKMTLSEEEVLSDNLYYYDPSETELTIVEAVV